MQNTYKQAAVRLLVFQEKNTWYGVALEFNIVVDGDNRAEVTAALEEATADYFKSAKKNKLGLEVINQTSDSEYETIWRQNFERAKRKFSLPGSMVHPSQVVVSAGYLFQPVAAAWS